MCDEHPRHSDSDFLVFFLTSQMTSEKRSKLISDIKRGDEYRDRVLTVDWPHEHSGSQGDIERLLRQACVQGLPFQAYVVGFIDDQSAIDNKVLMAESIEQDEKLSSSRRILSPYAARTAIARSLACIVLAEAVEED